MSMISDMHMALKGLCPKCKKASIFEKRTSLNPREECPECGFAVGRHDIGDGPAVFLIFILSFLVVPIALLCDHLYEIPLWVHAILWTGISLIACLLMLRPLKAYIILLQHRHLPRTFGEEEKAKTDQKDEQN